jgi:type IX secretion system PorP/SprF family membrane protein
MVNIPPPAMVYKLSALLSFLFFVLHETKCQDVHLTQYYTSNTFLNPAYTGNYDGDVRVVANARNQWRQITDPIRTNAISVEKKMHFYPDELGAGFIFINDGAGLQSLKTNKAMLSASFRKKKGAHLIMAGLQGGIVSRKLDISDQTFPNQWNYNGGNFDPSFSNGESSMQSQYVYPDFNAGIAWTGFFSKYKISAGYGLFHITRPKDRFGSADQRLNVRHVLNVSLSCRLSPTVALLPNLLFMQTGKASDFMFGINGKKTFHQDIYALAGAGYRGNTSNSDAFIAILGMGYKRLEVGFSLDFNFSGLSRDARTKSAWEISLTYTTPSLIPNKITVPCDRY